MLDVLQVVTVVLVVVAMAPALAHALKLPGKMRLTKEAYVAMQPIYYPGFTIAGGIGEAGGMISTIILLFLTPASARCYTQDRAMTRAIRLRGRESRPNDV